MCDGSFRERGGTGGQAGQLGTLLHSLNFSLWVWRAYNRQNKKFKKETEGLSSSERGGQGGDTVGTSQSNSPSHPEASASCDASVLTAERGHREAQRS